MTRRYRTLLGVLALAFAPSLFAANPCITGGAFRPDDGNGRGGTGWVPGVADGTGQGGTGHTDDGDGSGSGGTGMTVQVEGVITGFASICVNGLELHYSSDTPISLHGKAASPKDLAVGQVVHALARGQGVQLALQQLQVRHVLVAAVQDASPDGLRLLGRTIKLPAGMALPARLMPGTRIAVSGFSGTHGHPVITRLDVVPDDTPDSLVGEIQPDGQGGLSIEGVPLDAGFTQLQPGDFIRAEGRYSQGRLQVSRVERDERAMPVDRVVIQGRVRHADKLAVEVGGQRFLMDGQTRIKQALPHAGAWVKIDAMRVGRQLRVQTLETQAMPGSRPDKSWKQEKGATRPAVAPGEADRAASPGAPEHRAARREDDAVSFTRETERTEHEGRPDEIERHESPEKTERAEKNERAESVEKTEKIERPEKTEAPEKIERPEKTERSEKTERAEKIEKPEKVEKIEKPEKVERPEKIETPEKTERPESSEREH